jgi:ABC-type oligopeptide transport system ATPase subunit
VEAGESRTLFDNPQTEYTRALVAAVPHIRRAQAPTVKEGQST